MIQRRELPYSLTSSPIVPWTLVARTTLSRRPPASALATISSDSPREYTSAVSTKLIPASSARWRIRTESSWSVLPQAPNIIAPRHSGLTCMPVRPSGRCSIGRSLRGCPQGGRQPLAAALDCRLVERRVAEDQAGPARMCEAIHHPGRRRRDAAPAALAQHGIVLLAYETHKRLD